MPLRRKVYFSPQSLPRSPWSSLIVLPYPFSYMLKLFALAATIFIFSFLLVLKHAALSLLAVKAYCAKYSVSPSPFVHLLVFIAAPLLPFPVGLRSSRYCPSRCPSFLVLHDPNSPASPLYFNACGGLRCLNDEFAIPLWKF